MSKFACHFMLFIALLIQSAAQAQEQERNLFELASPSSKIEAKRIYIASPNADKDDEIVIRQIVSSNSRVSGNNTTFGEPYGPVMLIPVVSLRISRELLASVSAGVIFALDGDIDYVSGRDAPLATKIVETILGMYTYRASGPSIQAEIGVTGVKASAGFTSIAGTNVLFVLPIAGIGYTLKGSYLHKWSKGANGFEVGDAGSSYIGPEVDFMYQFVKVSMGLMKRVGGSEWILTAGVGIGL